MRVRVTVAAVIAAGLTMASGAGAQASDVVSGLVRGLGVGHCEAAQPAADRAAATAPPVGTEPCTGLRPGALIQNANEAGAVCTLSFLFQGSDGERYFVTAGHCATSPGAAVVTWTRGHGKVARTADGKRFGEFVFAVNDYVYGDPTGTALTSARDLSVIRLDRGARASGQICHFGGPVGLYTDTSTAPLVLHNYGYARGFGYVAETGTTTFPARTMLAPHGLPNPNNWGAFGVAYIGDSGSPTITDDGRAVGLLTSLPHVADPGATGNDVQVGTVEGVRLPQLIALAQRTLGIRLSLVTAPLL